MGKKVLKKAFAMLLCAVMVVALLPAGGLAAEGETHYIAVASDRHTNTTAISSAMGSMPASVEYADDGSAFPTYTWTVEMPAGTYKVTESANISGYTLEAEFSAEEVEIAVGGDAEVTITNTYTKKDTPTPPPPELDYENHYGYIVGYPDGTVRPAGNITRAEVATIFFRLLTDESRRELWCTENDFSDVSSEQWFNNAVSTLAHAGILSGYPDGTFKPGNKITRAELATIVARLPVLINNSIITSDNAAAAAI